MARYSGKYFPYTNNYILRFRTAQSQSLIIDLETYCTIPNCNSGDLANIALTQNVTLTLSDVNNETINLTFTETPNVE